MIGKVRVGGRFKKISDERIQIIVRICPCFKNSNPLWVIFTLLHIHPKIRTYVKLHGKYFSN